MLSWGLDSFSDGLAVGIWMLRPLNLLLPGLLFVFVFVTAIAVGLLDAEARADDWLRGNEKLNVFDVDVADAVVDADVVETVVRSRWSKLAQLLQLLLLLIVLLKKLLTVSAIWLRLAFESLLLAVETMAPLVLLMLARADELDCWRLLLLLLLLLDELVDDEPVDVVGLLLFRLLRVKLWWLWLWWLWLWLWRWWLFWLLLLLLVVVLSEREEEKLLKLAVELSDNEARSFGVDLYRFRRFRQQYTYFFLIYNWKDEKKKMKN